MNYIHHIPWQRNSDPDSHKTASPRMIPAPSLSLLNTVLPTTLTPLPPLQTKVRITLCLSTTQWKKVRKSEGKGSRFRHIKIRGKWPASRYWYFYAQETNPVPVREEARWIRQPELAIWRTEKCPRAGNRATVRRSSTHGLVTILTELHPHVFQEFHWSLFHTYRNTDGITGWYINSQNNTVVIRLDPTILSSEAA